MMKTVRKIIGVGMAVLATGGAIAGYLDRKENKDSSHKPYGIYEAYFKRPLDFICGMLALLVFWWLYLIIAVLVRVNLGSPVIFTQERPGRNEKIFKLYKFRTMTDARDENGELLPDEERLTRFGKWLRSTSLDELPEAFNIINGSLSCVGDSGIIGTTKKNLDFTRVSAA